jgi:hypothetical protein
MDVPTITDRINERRPQRDHRVNAHRVLFGRDRGRGWLQLVVQAGPAIQLPLPRTVDPCQQAGGDLRGAVRNGDQREKVVREIMSAIFTLLRTSFEHTIKEFRSPLFSFTKKIVARSLRRY